MKIHSICLRLIKAPLKKPFVTHLETVKDREAVVVEVMDSDGRTGFGEAVPFTSPWYTEETIKTCLHILEDYLIPLIFHSKWKDPSELPKVWSSVKRNKMAKSALEQALWDLYAKQREIYLGKLFGGVRDQVSAGTVIASQTIDEGLQLIEDRYQEGYERYKIKISPGKEVPVLTRIRREFPQLNIMADANGSYTLDMTETLKSLDDFHLLMVEQPLGFEDIVEHSILQKQIETPICLDESIHSYHDVKSALLLGSCKVITIKMAKLGGWNEALRVHNLCMEYNIPVWAGGMIEFGISKAHNIALATLPGFKIPGDIASSSIYWEHDIIEPEIVVKDGKIQVPHTPGIGFSINKSRLEKLTKHLKCYYN